jgi:hypothetical protein
VAAIEAVPADRIVVQAEYGLLPGAWVAARRGQPAPSLEAVHLCTNKYLSRRALEAAGVPVPRFFLASTAAEVRRAAPRFPVVLKPVASCLGRHVAQVARPEDLDRAVEEIRAALPGAVDVGRLLSFTERAGLDPGCDPRSQFLVEEYAAGLPFEADGIVRGSEIDLFGVTEQVVSPPPRFYLEGYLFPTDRETGIADSARRALRAVGLTHSGFSIEYRGETVIEVNGRLGEDEGFPELFRLGTGAYPILGTLGAPPTPRPPGRHALAYRNTYAGGTVTRVRTPPGVVAVVREGTVVEPVGSPGFSPHLAYAIATHPTSSRAAFDEARARLDEARIEVA